MSNADYEKYKSSSASFAQADQDLNALWSTLKQKLPQDQYKELLGEQRMWLREVYDAEAKKHMSAVSPAEAYASALNGRVSGLKQRFSAVLPVQGGSTAPKTAAQQDAASEFDLLAEAAEQVAGRTDSGVATTATVPPAPRQEAQLAPAPGTAVAATLPAQQGPTRVQVEAEGMGTTKMEALQAAWMDAVRNAVGMFMTANTRLEDDKLTEQIVTHSRGQVNSYEVLSETQQNNVWNIKIRANIDKDILQETAKAAQSKTVTFDGTAAVAQQSTQKTKAETQIEAMIASIDLFNFDDCLVYDFEVLKQDGSKPNMSGFYGIHSIRIDMKKYQQRVKAIKTFLEKICTRSDRVTFDDNYTNAAREGINAKFGSLQKAREGVVTPDSSGMRPFGFHVDGSNKIVVADTTSGCARYFFEDGVDFIKVFARPGYRRRIEFTFTVEHDDAFDGVVSVQKCNFTDMFTGVIVAPVFGGANNNLTYFKYKARLNLTDEQLVNVKGLKGKYSVRHYVGA